MNRSVLARQMFAKGGQAVPNEYKGFSMLPEEVQMKMDPAAAKKYQEGGEIRAGISEELRRDIDRVKSQLINERMDQQRQMENITALQALRNKARYDVPLLGLNDVSRELPANEEGFNPNNIYNILRFFDQNPEFDVSDYNEFFKTNLDPRDFSVLEKEAEPPAVGMAMGGDPAMAQGVGSMMPPPPAMPSAPAGGEQAIDPQVLEGALATAEQEITNLDEAEDFETVMNTIRGDEATVEERYEELAGVVGEEDARQTPESVLTLVQPAMVMGAVDQGIGGLAQQEMMEPVQGAMSQGIMSTVEPPQPAGGMGGPPPVNFKDGGLVRRGDNQPVKMMKAGGDPLQTAFESRLPIYEGILGDPTAQLEEQKKLTKANMLFDIANTALAFAAPMQGETPGMSGAERLAMAARTTQLPQTIGARAQSQLDAEKAAKAQQQQMRLSALTAAEADVTAQAKARADERKAALEAGYRINEIMLEQTGKMELAQNQANWKASLQDDQQAATEAIKRLEGDQSKEAIRLRKELENKNAIGLQLLKGEQAIEEIGLRSMNEIASLDKKHLQALALQENSQNLAREMKDIDVQMKSIDQAIAMEDQKLKEADMMQRAAIDANKQVLENKKLALQEREVKVKEAASGLNIFGKGTEGSILKLVSDEALLQRYANGETTQAESNILEQAINQFTQTRESVDPQTGAIVTKPGGTLVQSAQDAVKRRAERAGNLSLPAIATVLTSPETMRQRVNSLQFNTSLFDADSGAVNLESDSWSQIPTTIVDNNIRYEVATGLPSGLQRIANYFAETGREIGFGSGLSARGKELSQADADLDTLRNRLLLEMTNLSEDRVLKFVQEDLATETNDLRGSSFKTDERIYAKLTALEKGLARQLQNLAEIVPEYGGDGRKYPKSVESARKSANNIKGLIAEVQGFKNIYAKALETQSLGLNDRQRAAARDAYKATIRE